MEDQTETHLRNRKYTAELLSFFAYACALAVVMYFHEPWFDEAQAWLIARDATIGELIGSITHYEGHPPVWFLLLMPFAKAGVPFEIGVKSINFIFAASAMGLLIFKAPFSRAIRCVIPFTYFFFYQYGVISRPYSLMMLGFVLCALAYKNRNAKPYRFAGALAVVCGTSAYGIIIAAGIALVWLIEIIRERSIGKSIPALLANRRIHALGILFAINLFFVYCMIPYSDTYAANLEPHNTLLVRLFYMLFMAPADAVCSSSYGYSAIDISFNMQAAGSLIMGSVINLAIFTAARIYGKTSLFVVPYAAFAALSAFAYFYSHHLGIIVLFYVFLFWCMLGDRPVNPALPAFILRSVKGERDMRYLRVVGLYLIIIILIVQVYWTIAATYKDILKNYGTGRAAAEFITDNAFDELTIMTDWEKKTNYLTGLIRIDYNQLYCIPTLAYFDTNIFYNLNEGKCNKNYLTHIIDENGYHVKKLADGGYPDVLFGTVELKDIYGSKANLHRDYALVCSVHGNTIWKDEVFENRQLIFLRRDLLEKYPDLVELDYIQEM